MPPRRELTSHENGIRECTTKPTKRDRSAKQCRREIRIPVDPPDQVDTGEFDYAAEDAVLEGIAYIQK